MMFSNFAFEVGAVFLLVAGLMYFSLSGRIGGLFRGDAPKPFWLIVLAIGFGVYQLAPRLWDYMPSSSTPERHSAIPGPPPPPEPPRVAKSASRAPKPAAPRQQIIVVEQVPAAQVPLSAAPEAIAADPYDSKMKRGVKAVGRFLHIRKETRP